MADRLPNRPPRTNWGNLSKNLALWLLVGLLALALFQMMSRQRNPTQEFSYTEFSRQLDQGNIARVEVYDGKRLEGDFRSPVTQDGRSAKSFQVLLPVANSEVFIKRLEDANVPILAKEPKAHGRNPQRPSCCSVGTLASVSNEQHVKPQHESYPDGLP
jgi:ATP-dependent Zn protease